VWTGIVWLRIGTNGVDACKDGSDPWGSMKAGNFLTD